MRQSAICNILLLLLFVFGAKPLYSQQEFRFKYKLNTRSVRIVSVLDTQYYQHQLYHDLNANNYDWVYKKSRPWPLRWIWPKRTVQFFVVDYWQSFSSNPNQSKPPLVSSNNQGSQSTPSAQSQLFMPLSDTCSCQPELTSIGEVFDSFNPEKPEKEVFANIQQDQTTQRFTIKFWYFGSDNSFKPQNKDSLIKRKRIGLLPVSNYKCKNHQFIPNPTAYNYITFSGIVNPRHTMTIRFSEQQFSAVSIFYRYYFNGVGPGGSFTNANAAYYWIWGSTKFYTGQFIQPTNKYWGIGPYVGFSSPPSSGGGKSTSGQVTDLNLGASIFYSLLGLQLSAAYGFDFITSKNVAPYFGIGVGFKLINVAGGSSPSSSGVKQGSAAN